MKIYRISNETLPMPLYDDINEIKGEVMSWVEKYMDNHPQEEWKGKQAMLYREIAKFCAIQAEGLERDM